MKDNFVKKVAITHQLHLSQDADNFCRAFERHCGVAPSTLVENYIERNAISAIFLGGSIPLGIATGASDIDFIVLTTDEQSVRLNPTSIDARNIFSGISGDQTDSPQKTNVVADFANLEIDINFIRYSDLIKISNTAKASNTKLTTDQVMLLSRIKTGWLIDCAQEVRDELNALSADDSLEVRCSVNNLRNSFKAYGHAQVAASENPDLAIYLGRASVEWCFMALLASMGYAYPGEKWLKIFIRAVSSSGTSTEQQLAHLYDSGLQVLLPARTNTSAKVDSYLKDVGIWLTTVRTYIEQNPTYKLANRFCKQIYDLY